MNGPTRLLPQGPERGVTLLEVIIYSGLSLLLIGLAMGGLGTVQKGMFASNEIARMRGDADEAVQVMGRDLRNLGLKRLFYKAGPGDFVDTLIEDASFVPGDSSSFIHRDGAKFDTLVFLRAGLDGAGIPIGVDTVTYRVDPASQTLLRSVNGEAPMALSTRIEALQFSYGLSAGRLALLKEKPPAAARWTAVPSGDVTFSGASLKASKTGAGAVTFWQSKTRISTSASRRYAFDLRGFGDASLQSSLDSLVVMVCTPTGSVVASEAFKVGTTAMDYRIELAAPDCGNCRAGLRMKVNGPGSLILTSFSFSEVSQGNLTWTASPTLAQKRAVGAVRIYLLVGTDKPIYGMHAGDLRLANATLRFQDRKGRSLLDEVIPTPNNGP